MLKEERGRRVLTAALSRHMVGRRIPFEFYVILEYGSILGKIQMR